MSRKTSLIFACVLCCATAESSAVTWGGLTDNNCDSPQLVYQCGTTGCHCDKGGVCGCPVSCDCLSDFGVTGPSCPSQCDWYGGGCSNPSEGAACVWGSCGGANGNHIQTCTKGTWNSVSCTCGSITTSYRCEAGYWGSPTNASSGCTVCPGSHPNSTAGSNSTQSTCNVSCTACAATSGATCTLAAANATYNNSCSYTTGCSAGYYGPASGAGTYNPACTRCPDVTTSNGWSPNTITRTSTAGTTVPITSCYIPSGTTDIDDEIGTFTSFGTCQYQL